MTSAPNNNHNNGGVKMKKRILLLFILTILFSTGMEGCPELDPMNYVEFTLTSIIKLQFKDYETGEVLPLQTNGALLDIYNKKDGARYCWEHIEIGMDGTSTLICTHNVYKEQPVECHVHLFDLPNSVASGYIVDTRGFPNTVVCKLSWEEIFDLCGEKFNSSCSMTVNHTLVVYLKHGVL